MGAPGGGGRMGPVPTRTRTLRGHLGCSVDAGCPRLEFPTAEVGVLAGAVFGAPPHAGGLPFRVGAVEACAAVAAVFAGQEPEPELPPPRAAPAAYAKAWSKPAASLAPGRACPRARPRPPRTGSESRSRSCSGPRPRVGRVTEAEHERRRPVDLDHPEVLSGVLLEEAFAGRARRRTDARIDDWPLMLTFAAAALATVHGQVFHCSPLEAFFDWWPRRWQRTMRDRTRAAWSQPSSTASSCQVAEPCLRSSGGVGLLMNRSRPPPSRMRGSVHGGMVAATGCSAWLARTVNRG